MEHTPDGTLAELRPKDWAQSLVWASQSLDSHADGLDALNVVPTADHDTGANAAATLAVIAEGLGDPAAHRSFSELAQLVRAVAQQGATGWIGTALAGYVTGLGESFANLDSASPLDVAVGLEAAAERLAEVSTDAIDGLVVEVATCCGQGALAEADRGGDLSAVVIAAADAGLDALERAPKQHDALSEAGVVDAGSAALMVLVDALSALVSGEPVALADPADHVSPDRAAMLIEATFELSGPRALAVTVLSQWSTDPHPQPEERGHDLWEIKLDLPLAKVGPAINAAMGLGPVSNLVLTGSSLAEFQ